MGSCEFWEISKNTFFYRTPPMTASDEPVDTGRKLNGHRTFRKRPGRLLNVLGEFSLRPVPTEKIIIYKKRTSWRSRDSS